MTTQISPLPIQRFYDNNNNPLAGGQLYTYIAGTTTPLATYTDSTGTTPNTNPVIMNARGEANVWMTQGQAYKFVLRDASAVLIWTEDQLITGVNSSNSVTYLAPYSGAVARTDTSKLSDIINVHDFGAVGDGVTNDTAAFTAAFAALGITGGVVEILGSKMYRTDTLNLPAGVVLRGRLPKGDSPIDNVTMPIAQWGSAIVLNAGATINLHSSCGIDSVMVRPYGMIFPQTYATSWVGTAITLVAGVAYGAFVTNSFIVGFSIGITSNNNSRVLFDKLWIDCNNCIQLTATFDSCYVTNIHGWPYATQASFWASGGSYAARDKTMLFRSGTGLLLDSGSDDTCIDNVLFYGYLYGAQFLNAAGINCGKLWIDHPFGMARTGNIGVYCGPGSSNVVIKTLWLWSMNTGLVLAQNATDQVLIDTCVSRTIDTTCVSVQSGNLHIGRHLADSAVNAISLASTVSRIRVSDAIYTNISGQPVVVPASTDASHVKIVGYTDRANGTQIIGPNSMGFVGIPSADPLLPPSTTDEFITVTGITSFGNIGGGYAGRKLTLFFQNALTVSSGGSFPGGMNLSGGVSFTAAAGRNLSFVHDGTVWQEVGRKS